MNISTIAGVARRQWLTILAALVVGLFLFVVLEPVLRKYTASSTVLISTASDNSAVLDPTRDPTSGGIGVDDLGSLLSSSHVTQRVVADLHLSGREADRVAGELRTKNSPGSSVLPITFTDRDPSIAVAGANAGATELARYDADIKTSRYDRLVADLRNQIAASRRHLGAIDTAIASVTTGDAFVTEANGTSALNTRITTLSQQRDLAMATLQGDEAAANVAQDRPALAADAAKKEIENADPTLLAVREQYGKDLAQSNNLSAGYKPSFPGLEAVTSLASRERVGVDREIKAAASDPKQSPTYVAALLDANKARAAVANDNAQLQAIEGQLSGLTEHLSGAGSASTHLASYLRDRTASEASYRELALSLSKAEADRAQAASIDSIVVIDRATSATQSTFSKPSLLGSALFVVALWLGLTLAFFLDGNDRRLNTPESIEALYGKPVFVPVG